MKKFLFIILVIVGLLAAGLAYIYVNLGSITKTILEDTGSAQLGVPVHISSLDIDIVQRSAALDTLRIGNPTRFSSHDAFSVSSIKTRLGALKTDLVTIEELEIGDINVLLEVANQTTNLQAIQANLPKSEPRDAGSQMQAPDVIIKKVSFETTSLEPKISGLGMSVAEDIGTLSVPGFTLTNIGTAENGVSIGQAIRQIMQPYLNRLEQKAIKDQLYKKLPQEKLNELKGKLQEDIQQKSKDIESGIKKQIEEKTGDVEKEIGDKLKGLMGE